jgi:hypothetical protein
MSDPTELRFCTICHEHVYAVEYFYHFITEHPSHLAVSALFMPEPVVDSYFSNVYNNTLNYMLDNELLDYEGLQRLCDEIGYHKVGVSNVMDVVQRKYKKDIAKGDCCPICMEEFASKKTIYELKKCKHIYCKECIGKWFEENKNCPVCKSDVTPD